MAHLQYMPGDPRLVDQLVYELKSKGIFDQFRKECIADVDTRPAYQNLRQRVENSVSTFLARQCWKPDLNKNQLREKLRKHILDGNYLEQGVERIVDQVVNPKVASVFIPQVEDLVYNYLGISRKKSVPTAETSNGKISTEDLLPTDLEAVSPGSVKSNDDKDELMDTDLPEEVKMDVEEEKDVKEDSLPAEPVEKPKEEEPQTTEVIVEILDSDVSIDKSNIPLPTEDIRLENIPAPENSPPKIELENIELPKEPNISKEIPLPDQIPLPQDNVPKEQYFKPINLNSDDDSSSDSSLRRNMSPLTPIRNYNNENSCDAQQGFDNDSDSKSDEKKVPSTFRFAIELKSTENSLEGKEGKKDATNLAYQFNNQVNINTFTTPMYEDSSNSHNLHIDYESDANSKNIEKVPETDHNSEDSKKEKKSEDKKSSHKSSHRSRDSHRHSSSKDKRSDSKHSTSRDSSRHDKKPKDDHSSKSKSSHRERERSRDKSEKKDSRDSSKHRSHRSSSHKDSKSHRSSSSSQKHSSKQSDRKSSSNKDKERSSEKSSDKSSKERDRKDSKSSSHRSDKDRKSSSSSNKSKHEDKDKKKEKKDTDDHYSLSGRGNHTRRSTDRDSNDGSSSSKGSNNQTGAKSSEAKKESKDSSSKSDNTSTSGESTSPSDKEVIVNNASDKPQQKPIRVENHLEMPIASPPRLPFVPDVTLKKPKFAANLAEAKKMMRMRKFLDEEQKRMNQEAALLLEFQANVRPSLSQVYSSIPGPELEFACVTNEINAGHVQNQVYETENLVETAETDISDVQNEMTVINNDNEVKSDEVNDEKNMEVVNDDESINTEAHENETYNENKPFSQLVNEISERNKSNDVKFENLHDDENKMRTEYFEVTIITEELSESEEPETANKTENITETANTQDTEKTEQDPQNAKQDTVPDKVPETTVISPDEEKLHYFAEHEKFDAEIKRHQYSNFFKCFTDKQSVSNRIYLFNCDTYEENILKEVSASFGNYEIINYYRNGHLTLPKPAKNVVNVNLASEITLPLDSSDSDEKTSSVFSPVKSECSFELSSDYDAKLEEMVNKTSRQEVMEIILGSVTDRPTIDYCTESSIESDVSLKRKIAEAESTVNNNRPVLTPKIRKLSESDQISSTTEETEEISNNNRTANTTRSKYLGKARRVGLPRPRRSNLANSPSSDKSVENYAQNTPAPAPPNGKLKPPRAVQRYDTADLYKPKLHYLSRRNNIS